MTASRRTICVATGSRADYGHLAPVLRAIAAEPVLKLQVLATGQHLEPRFGETLNEIIADGFAIDAEVSLDLADDTPQAMARAVGTGVSRSADALAILKPDIVLVLGDRF
ncbi:MAG: UDP-N-acetylglucosamine 2-epimerase [Rhodobacteraceae bacterium]|nr:UDP-N-acetylglucosamine 2-epimerase [Paracoccaceae bacterium]